MKVLVAICLLALGANASTVGFVTPKGNVGRSGIVRIDGTVDQFGHDLAHDILFFGPSGAVTKSGSNLQFTSDLHIANPRSKRALYISRDALIGESGIVNPDGRNVQFTPEQVGSFILKGPSGIVTSTGDNIQFTRRRRSLANFEVTKDSVVGASGIVQPDGKNIQFTPEQAEAMYYVVKGPSGIVTADGKNIQFSRKKRHLVGSSGMILDDGTQVQFMKAGATILLDGPSGLVLSDGTLVQKRA